jgi:hypothetical protein
MGEVHLGEAFVDYLAVFAPMPGASESAASAVNARLLSGPMLHASAVVYPIPPFAYHSNLAIVGQRQRPHIPPKAPSCLGYTITGFWSCRQSGTVIGSRAAARLAASNHNRLAASGLARQHVQSSMKADASSLDNGVVLRP